MKKLQARKLVKPGAVAVIIVAGLLFFYAFIGSIKPQADAPSPSIQSKKVFLARQVGFNQNETSIDGITIDGNGQLETANDLIRVIFEDSAGKNYLVLEQNGIYSPSKTFNFQNFGEETTYLNKVSPTLIKIEKTSGAKITINKINLIRLSSEQSTIKKIIDTIGINIEADINTTTVNLEAQQKELKDSLESEKVKNLNTYLEKNDKSWRAGETEISKAALADKEKIFGSPLPNLDGLEYYISGIFDFGSNPSANSANVQNRQTVPNEQNSNSIVPTDSVPSRSASASFPSSFDWRNRNGASFVTSVKNQGTTCGACWTFSAVAGVESLLNLRLNKAQNLDLSEQWGICTTTNGCDGGAQEVYPYLALSGLGNSLPEESVFPYLQKDSRDGICPKPLANSNNGVKISDFRFYYRGALPDASQAAAFSYLDKNGFHADELSLTDAWLKEKIIKYGPLDVGLKNEYFGTTGQYNHAVSLVGWNTGQQGQTIWIAKNSWGTSWGQQGYLYATIGDLNTDIDIVAYAIDPYFTKAENTINCTDKDKDGYYNWGISSVKSSSCPANTPAQEDCDDSNANLGPYDANYNCVKLSSSATATPTQTATVVASITATAQTAPSPAPTMTSSINAAANTAATATGIVGNPAVPATPAQPTTTTSASSATAGTNYFVAPSLEKTAMPDKSASTYSVTSSTPTKYVSPYSPNQNEFIVAGVKSGPSVYVILLTTIAVSSGVLFYLRDKNKV